MLWVDRFGNLQFNIAAEDLATLELGPGDDVALRYEMSSHRITWGDTYGSVEEGEAVFHVDSHGQIALAVRAGSPAEDFPIGVGDSVVIGRPDGGNALDIRAVD